jgi:hypothetical protein
LGLRLFAPQKFPCAYAPALIPPPFSPTPSSYRYRTLKIEFEIWTGKNLEFAQQAIFNIRNILEKLVSE